MIDQELLQIMNKLDSQLTILNIEGICSECNIYEWESKEYQEHDCKYCDGNGEIMCDLDEWHECRICEGAGIIEDFRTTIIREVEITSNI